MLDADVDTVETTLKRRRVAEVSIGNDSIAKIQRRPQDEAPKDAKDLDNTEVMSGAKGLAVLAKQSLSIRTPSNRQIKERTVRIKTAAAGSTDKARYTTVRMTSRLPRGAAVPKDIALAPAAKTDPVAGVTVKQQLARETAAAARKLARQANDPSHPEPIDKKGNLRERRKKPS